MDRMLETLVAMPSICADYPAANRILSFAEQELKRLGMYISRHEDHRFPSLATTTRKTKHPKVLLTAHLDTVDAPAELFRLRLESGRYYGRGVLDMKSAAANYINVLRGIPNLKRYDIGVMLTTDEEYYGQYGTATLNISIIQGGTSINQIPASASATLDIRYVDATDFKKLRRTILSICDQYGISLKTIRKATNPTICDIEHPLVTAFTHQVAKQTGITPLPFIANGTTDARYFAEHGIPCIILSPPGGEAHDDNEWLDKAGYEQYAIILRNYLDEVARLTPGSKTKTPTEALTLVR